jgi:3-hydroxy-3-methylglutaryl CoA synthase
MPTVVSRERYVPQYRLRTSELRARWGGGSKGVATRAVHARDEDSLTLALQAGERALADRDGVDAVFFASATPVYRLGTTTPFLAERLGLDDRTHVQTFTASSRAGTAALRAAQAVVGSEVDSALVVAAEAPTPTPRSDWERVAGSGAAAVVVEADGDGLDPVATGSCARPLLDQWQAPGDDTRADADARFAREKGYLDITRTAVTRALTAAGWEVGAVDTFVVNHPNGSFAGRLASALGLGDGVLSTPELGRDYGDLGAASALASLALAPLAASGRVVVANYGSGIADAVAYEATGVPAPASAGPTAVDLPYLDYLEHVAHL